MFSRKKVFSDLNCEAKTSVCWSWTSDGKLIDVRSCGQWQFTAFTVTLAWINLLFYMRQLYGIGKYIILFQDVLLTFMAIVGVFLILLIAFAFGFHLLLKHQDQFANPWDAILKTMIMMSGEIDYGDIFFKDLSPKGFDSDWDQGFERVPFVGTTYTIFVIFFVILSIVALNVLVGLTVDDIRNFIDTADLRKLSARLKYVLQMERLSMRKVGKLRRSKPADLDNVIRRSAKVDLNNAYRDG